MTDNTTSDIAIFLHLSHSCGGAFLFFLRETTMIDTTTHTNYSTYIMAFGAHPDDSDVGVGGTILRAVDHGHTAIMVDLTPSQRSTHGDPQTRQAEAQLAASRLSPQTRIDRINM